MGVVDKLTNLANEVRDVSNLSQKMSVDDISKEVSQMSGLSNYFIAKMPTMSDGKGHTSIAHGSAQRFSNQGGLTGELVRPADTSITISALKGDVVTQSFVMKTDAKFKNLNFNFQIDADQPIIAGAKQLANNTYKLYASYTVSKDTPLTLMQFWADCRGGTFVELSQPYAAIQ